ncbi:MAG: hypothetical protein RIQ33_1552 [Bacteroidota bacterium]|jgi:hypothetical protein
MLHISQVINKQKTIEYCRKPTKGEIKFGHGATHYRDFDFDKCFDESGFIKLKVKASDDGLIYFYTGLDYYNKLKFQKIEVD